MCALCDLRCSSFWPPLKFVQLRHTLSYAPTASRSPVWDPEIPASPFTRRNSTFNFVPFGTAPGRPGWEWSRVAFAAVAPAAAATSCQTTNQSSTFLFLWFFLSLYRHSRPRVIFRRRRTEPRATASTLPPPQRRPRNRRSQQPPPPRSRSPAWVCQMQKPSYVFIRFGVGEFAGGRSNVNRQHARQRVGVEREVEGWIKAPAALKIHEGGVEFFILLCFRAWCFLLILAQPGSDM